MAYEDIPIIDPEIAGAQIVDPDDYEPPKVRPVVKKRQRKPKVQPVKPATPIKPIKVTQEQIDAQLSAMDEEYARRLFLKQQQLGKEQEDAYSFQSLQQAQSVGIDPTEAMRQANERRRMGVEYLHQETKKFIKTAKPRALRKAIIGKNVTPLENFLIQVPEDMSEPPPLPDTTIRPSGRVSNDIAAFLAPVAQMGPMTVEGVVELVDFVNSLSPGATEEEIAKGNIGPHIKPYTRDASSFIRGALPVDAEKYPESKLLGGLGSAAGFLAGGLGLKALGLPAKISTALLGVGVNVADVVREAEAAGIDPKRRDATLLLAAATGLTEMAGLGKTIQSFGLSKMFYRRMFEIAEEGGQEGLQQWLNNINAAIVGGYDSKRPLSKDVLEGIILGAAVGGVVQGGSYGYQKYREKISQPDLPPVINPRNIARIPPPASVPRVQPQRRVPQTTQMQPMWDMIEMAKKPEDKKKKFKERFDEVYPEGYPGGNRKRDRNLSLDEWGELGDPYAPDYYSHDTSLEERNLYRDRNSLELHLEHLSLTPTIDSNKEKIAEALQGPNPLETIKALLPPDRQAMAEDFFNTWSKLQEVNQKMAPYDEREELESNVDWFDAAHDISDIKDEDILEVDFQIAQGAVHEAFSRLSSRRKEVLNLTFDNWIKGPRDIPLAQAFQEALDNDQTFQVLTQIHKQSFANYKKAQAKIYDEYNVDLDMAREDPGGTFERSQPSPLSYTEFRELHKNLDPNVMEEYSQLRRKIDPYWPPLDKPEYVQEFEPTIGEDLDTTFRKAKAADDLNMRALETRQKDLLDEVLKEWAEGPKTTSLTEAYKEALGKDYQVTILTEKAKQGHYNRWEAMRRAPNRKIRPKEDAWLDDIDPDLPMMTKIPVDRGIISQKMSEIADLLGMNWNTLDPRVQESLKDDVHILISFFQGGRFTGQEDARLYVDIIKRARNLQAIERIKKNPDARKDDKQYIWSDTDYDKKLEFLEEAIRIHNLKTGPPNPQVKPQSRDVVTDPNEREDNLLEWMKDSKAFTAKGNPAVGHAYSYAPTEHTIVNPTVNHHTPYGNGLLLFQDPEAAEDPSMMTNFQYQDFQDHPDFEGLVKSFLPPGIEYSEQEHRTKKFNDELDWANDWDELQAIQKAREEAIEIISQRVSDQWTFQQNKQDYRYQSSRNIRPYYMNVTNPFDVDKEYSMEEAEQFLEATRAVLNSGLMDVDKKIEPFKRYGEPGQFANLWEQKTHETESKMTNVHRNILDKTIRGEQIFDEDTSVQTGYTTYKEKDPYITGHELWFALEKEFKNQFFTQNILKKMGYDGVTYMTHLASKQFERGEEAKATEWADKVGGELVTERPIEYKTTYYLTAGNSPHILKTFDNLPDAEAFVKSQPMPSLLHINESKQEVPPDPNAEPFKPEVRNSRAWIVFEKNQLKSATGNTGRFRQDDLDVSQAKKKRGYDDPKYKASEDDFAFDVMPALSSKYGRAPYLRAPQWFFDVIGKSGVGGTNIPGNRLQQILDDIVAKSPSQEHADVAFDAVVDLVQQSKAEGIYSLNFVNTSIPQEYHRGVIEHEVTHAAQRDFAFDPAWYLNHPMVRNVLNRTHTYNRKDGTRQTVGEYLFGDMELTDEQLHREMAKEMVTYWIQENYRDLRMNESEGRQFFKDYINRLRDEYGQGGLDQFIATTRLSPGVHTVVDESNIEWAVHEATMPSVADRMMMQPSDDLTILAAKKPGGKLGRPYTPKSKILKNKVQDAINWASTRMALFGRRILEENPPAPTVPVDEPITTPPPPAPPGRGPGGGADHGPFGPLFKTTISPEYTRIVTRTFQRMLKEGGVPEVDATDAPFMQVVAALNRGQLQNVDMGEILKEEGLDWEIFSEELKETASASGSTLQAFSEISRFWNAIVDEWEIKEGLEKPHGGRTGPKIPGDPEALYRLVPMSVKTARALKGVRSTALGKNMWQRSGNVTQKAMLTQLSTAIINTATATGQIPLRMVTHGMGAFMFNMLEGHGNIQTRWNDAVDDMQHSMAASLELIFAMDPSQIGQWIQGRKSSTQFAHYQHVIYQLEQQFPDIHKKLFALSSGTETLKTGKRQLQLARNLARHIPRTDPKRDQILKDIEMYEQRLDTNATALGKLLNGTEAVYDWFLQPMQIAEYFVRRPIFVAQLNLELYREGLDLAYIVASNQMDIIPEAAMERAINKALEVTFAYMPGTTTGTDYVIEKQVEKAAEWLIQGLNKWGGPINALIGEPFAKAAFNGAKFVYEYSPLGGILPFGRIIANKTPFAKTFFDPNIGPRGARRKTNPTTHQDYDRLAKAMLGTFMYATVYYLRQAIGGEEWWQLKTGKKGPDGRPIYTDIRRLRPQATVFQMYDLFERMAQGRIRDVDVVKEFGAIMTGIRIHDNMMGGSILETAADWFRTDDFTKKSAYLRAEEEAGKAMAVYLTPMLNLRDAIAQFDEEFGTEENVKKDTRGTEYSALGPVMEKIPFLRNLLPNLTSPTEPSPIQLSVNPIYAQLGEKQVIAKNFAGREWARLGIFESTFLSRDTDPIINRAQNISFQRQIADLAAAFETDPKYLNATDDEKAMMWEAFISGDDGIAAAAREEGEMANPNEALRRDAENTSGMGRFTRKATGYDKFIKDMFNKK